MDSKLKASLGNSWKRHLGFSRKEIICKLFFLILCFLDHSIKLSLATWFCIKLSSTVFVHDVLGPTFLNSIFVPTFLDSIFGPTLMDLTPKREHFLARTLNMFNLRVRVQYK